MLTQFSYSAATLGLLPKQCLRQILNNLTVWNAVQICLYGKS